MLHMVLIKNKNNPAKKTFSVTNAKTGAECEHTGYELL